ncbi:5'-3' exonuclease [Streptomyces sp. CoH17]|uniref:5'-3' exonuclease n=1 Tax=Streptomyces sp. CoH17 TaxID=2992806 RepID=UPI00226F055F|nr:hypothetical protein [Streptomyces sp. CoH17]
MSELLMVLDGHNLMTRAWFGMQIRNPDGTIETLKTSDGRETGGLYGVIKTFMTYARQLQPTHVLWTFDHGRSKYRLGIRPEYKGNRGPKDYDLTFQFKAFDEFLSLMDVRYYREEGVEADDLMACSARWKSELPVTIVSVDHDIRQLVSKKDHGVTVLKPSMGRNGGEVFYTYDKVLENYDGLRPEQLPELWALTGDGGDNVIGIRGIGYKRGHKLLEGGQKRLTEVLDHPKVSPYAQQVIENYQLIKLDGSPADFHVQLGECLFSEEHADKEGLIEFCKEYEFNSFLREIEEGTFWPPAYGKAA